MARPKMPGVSNKLLKELAALSNVKDTATNFEDIVISNNHD